LKKRFLINEEAVSELKRENCCFIEGGLESPCGFDVIRAHRKGLDNLLNNLRTPCLNREASFDSVYRKDLWAVAEVTNTGEIREETGIDTSWGRESRGLHIPSG